MYQLSETIYKKIIRNLFFTYIFLVIISLSSTLSFLQTNSYFKILSISISIFLSIITNSKKEIIETYLNMKQCKYEKILGYVFLLSSLTTISLYLNIILGLSTFYFNDWISILISSVIILIASFSKFLLKLFLEIFGYIPSNFLNKIDIKKDKIISIFSLSLAELQNSHEFYKLLSENYTDPNANVEELKKQTLGPAEIFPAYTIEERSTKDNDKYYVVLRPEYADINNLAPDQLTKLLSTNPKLKVNIPIITDYSWHTLNQTINEQGLFNTLSNRFKKSIINLYKSLVCIILETKIIRYLKKNL